MSNEFVRTVTITYDEYKYLLHREVEATKYNKLKDKIVPNIQYPTVHPFDTVKSLEHSRPYLAMQPLQIQDLLIEAFK